MADTGRFIPWLRQSAIDQYPRTTQSLREREETQRRYQRDRERLGLKKLRMEQRLAWLRDPNRPPILDVHIFDEVGEHIVV